MKNYKKYGGFIKPYWAPPAWLFAPAWSFLYVCIAISFSYVVYLSFLGTVPPILLVPFGLNLVFNALFTWIEFKLQKLWLAAVDTLLVTLTIIWGMLVIFRYAPWVVYINIPYLLWTSFASVLAITIAAMNSKKREVVY
jgi:benzodiazapine receptor